MKWQLEPACGVHPGVRAADWASAGCWPWPAGPGQCPRPVLCGRPPGRERMQDTHWGHGDLGEGVRPWAPVMLGPTWGRPHGHSAASGLSVPPTASPSPALSPSAVAGSRGRFGIRAPFSVSLSPDPAQTRLPPGHFSSAPSAGQKVACQGTAGRSAGSW